MDASELFNEPKLTKLSRLEQVGTFKRTASRDPSPSES